MRCHELCGAAMHANKFLDSPPEKLGVIGELISKVNPDTLKYKEEDEDDEEEDEGEDTEEEIEEEDREEEEEEEEEDVYDLNS